MEPELENADMPAVQGVAVECVTFDRAERPKRRRIIPLVRLLVPVAGPSAATCRDAG